MNEILHYEWANNAHMTVPTAIIITFIVASFFVLFFTILRTISKLDIAREADDEANLDWSERMGRRDARGARLYTDPAFERERRLLTRSALCFVGGLAALFVIDLVFGNPS
jgi:hypothetical protein